MVLSLGVAHAAVDIETLKATNESLISTLDEILNIQTRSVE